MTEIDPPTHAIGAWLPADEEDYEADPWEWMDTHAPVLELRCESERVRVGRVWRIPGNLFQYEGYANQRPVIDGTQAGGPSNLMLDCPKHGLVLAPAAWVMDMADTTRRAGNIQCADPHPVYTLP